MPLAMEVGLSPRDFVLDGDPTPPPKKEAEPGAEPHKFSAHLYCGQTAGLIKMALGQSTLCYMETHLPYPKKGTEPPLAHLYCG